MKTKQVYHADDNLQTLTIPYIPDMGVNGSEIPLPPSYFYDRYEVPGFYLSEIYGSHLVWDVEDSSWSEIGFHAIYRREQS